MFSILQEEYEDDSTDHIDLVKREQIFIGVVQLYYFYQKNVNLSCSKSF